MKSGRTIGRRSGTRRLNASNCFHKAIRAMAEPLEGRMLLSVCSPVGPEFLLTEGMSVRIGADAKGDLVAIWGEDTSTSYNEYAQRYDASGNLLGDRIPIHGARPDLAVSPSGDFVLAWSSSRNVYAQRFNAEGEPQGDELQVSTTAADWCYPAVAINADGGFAVAWQACNTGSSGGNIYARTYGANGAATSDEFQANVVANSAEGYTTPDVGLSSYGTLVASWTTPDGYGSSVHARIFNPAGAAQTDEFQVNPPPPEHTISSAASPAIAMQPSGEFSIAWIRGNTVDFAQYDAAGTLRGPVATSVGWAKRSMASNQIAVDAQGRLTMVWEGTDNDSSGWDIFARRFDASAQPESEQLRVNTNTAGDQRWPVLAMGGDGNFIVAWSTRDAGSTSAYVIRAQRYAVSDTPGAVVGLAWNDLNSNGIQDGQESGVDGLEVTLFNADGSLVGSTLTSGGGSYRFDVAPGSYFLRMAPAGYFFTASSAGADPSLDSDIDPATGRSAAVAVGAGQTMQLDAGLLAQPMVSGTVYLDGNANGLRDGGEVGLGGWIVYADANGNGQLDAGEASTNSRPDGSYSLVIPATGAVTLRVVGQQRWTTAEAKTLTLSPWQLASGVDFGNRTDVPLTTAGPINPQIKLNTTTAGSIPAIAVAPDGRFVAVWVSGSSTQYRVYAQRFSAAGQPLGSAIAVSSGSGSTPVVAIQPNGDFAVAWGTGQIDARCFTADGAALGSEFGIGTGSNSNSPAIAADPNGGFLVTWRYIGTNWDLVARRISAAGQPSGPQFMVATDTQRGDEQYASIAFDTAGNFVIAWEVYISGRYPKYINAQRFDANGNKVGPEFRVSPPSDVDELKPSIAMNGDGDFVIAWAVQGKSAPWEIHAQRYSAAGVAQGSPLVVSSSSQATQRYAKVAMSPDGSFVVTWQRLDSLYSPVLGFYGRRFNSAGLPEGEEFRIDVPAPSVIIPDDSMTSGTGGTVGMDAQGNFVAAWADASNAYAQRYQVGFIGGAISGRVWNDANGNGLQDASESGANGVAVSLYSAAGQVIGSTTTYGGGLYWLVGVVPGMDYFVRFTAPSGQAFALAHAGSDDTLDSDADPFTGRTGTLSLVPGQQVTGLDAGLVRSSSVSGSVFYDANKNGTVDLGETLAGWQVYIDANGNGVLDADEPSIVYSSGGTYSISGLPPGPALLRVVAPRYWESPEPVALNFTVGSYLIANLPQRPLAASTTAAAVGQPIAVNNVSVSVPKGPTAIAAAPDGQVVIVWTGTARDGSGDGIYARRCDAAGGPQGDEFRVNTSKPVNPSVPVVAVNAAGDFVVTWQADGLDGSGSGIFARCFAADGTPLGSDFQVNTTTINNQSRPAVAMSASGDFVITWDSQETTSGYGIYTQRYRAGGAPDGGELRLTANPGQDQKGSAVGMDALGNYVIAWLYQPISPGAVSLVARRFASDGTALTDVFQVNSSSVNPYTTLAVAMNPAGDFLVAWRGALGMAFRRYNAGGSALGVETPYNGGQSPVAAMAGDGGFAIASTGLPLLRYNASGLRLDSLNLPAGFSNFTLAMDCSGGFATAAYRIDATGPRIYLQRYHIAAPADPVIVGESGDDPWRLACSADQVQTYLDGPTVRVQMNSFPKAALNTLRLDLGDGNDTLTLDLSSGDPIPAGGLTVNGGNGLDRLTIVGTAASDSIRLADGQLFINGSAISLAGIEQIILGANTPSALLASLTLEGASSLSLASGKALCLSGLSLGPDAALDLSDGALIVQADPASRDQLLASISQAIASKSLRTSQADELHGLAAILNQDSQAKRLYDTFSGQAVNENSLLVKLTWNGDADVNGILDGSDYFFIDKGYLSRNLPNPPGGYRNGDFNYDGTIDGSDYFLIDKAFLAQNTHVPPAPLAAVAAPQTSVFSAKPIADMRSAVRVRLRHLLTGKAHAAAGRYARGLDWAARA